MLSDEVPSSASNIMGVRHETTTARMAIWLQKKLSTQPKGQREEVLWFTAKELRWAAVLPAFHHSAVFQNHTAWLAVIGQCISEGTVSQSVL